jgi:membrane-associated phospholipid phosphatase
LFAVQLYSLMVAVRIVAMFLLPLNPPTKMIILNDPFVEFFGTGQTLTKDLFFSGHTATLFILFLVSENKIIKTIFLISTIAVAISVIMQHVHYSIDVFAAVFFAYACYKLVEKIKTYFLL